MRMNKSHRARTPKYYALTRLHCMRYQIRLLCSLQIYGEKSCSWTPRCVFFIQLHVYYSQLMNFMRKVGDIKCDRKERKLCFVSITHNWSVWCRSFTTNLKYTS